MFELNKWQQWQAHLCLNPVVQAATGFQNGLSNDCESMTQIWQNTGSHTKTPGKIQKLFTKITFVDSTKKEHSILRINCMKKLSENRD